MTSPLDRLQENTVQVVSILVTAIWMGALFLDQDWWLAALIIGYVAVLPLTKMLAGEEDEHVESGSATRTHDQTASPGDATTDDQSADSALDTLRERYARGELTEEQFERKVERLLETDTVENASDHLGSEERSTRERELDTERS